MDSIPDVCFINLWSCTLYWMGKIAGEKERRKAYSKTTNEVQQADLKTIGEEGIDESIDNQHLREGKELLFLVPWGRTRDLVTPLLRCLYWLPTRPHIQYKLSFISLLAPALTILLNISFLTMTISSLFLPPEQQHVILLVCCDFWTNTSVSKLFSVHYFRTNFYSAFVVATYNLGTLSICDTCLQVWA